MLHDRRAFLGYFTSIGLGSTLLPGVLWGRVAAGEEITPETIAAAEEIAGVQFTPDERQQMVKGLERQEQQIDALHKITIPNSVAPAIKFDPLLPGETVDTKRLPLVRSAPAIPARVPPDDELAFLPVTELSELVRRRKVTSTQLTQLYLSRLKKYDPLLHFVITLTEDRALRQAAERDAELKRGKYRGPLHGIPWGGKDLLAVKGYPTTWGAAPYKDQVIDTDATVVRRLDDAGAVLVAKLTLGALAQGDVWFGGTTRNPWKPDQGSSGSSAGPASATAAGCVGFSVGSETLGSISSPSTRCGDTGLRPTFGFVPRTGAMALSWSMDKLGPICRGVEDCALVMHAIYGPDGEDLTVHDAAFNWNAHADPRKLRVGYFKAQFDSDDKRYAVNKPFDQATLDTLRKIGFDLKPVEMPDEPYGALTLVLDAEAAAAFDELTRTGRDKEMTAQGDSDWPNVFRRSRFIPAVDYVNANRARVFAMQAWRDLFKGVDVIVTPTFSGQLTATNLTGQPAVIVPNGFRETDGTPVSITFLADLYQDAKALSVARAYQQATDFHTKHPTLVVGAAQ